MYGKNARVWAHGTHSFCMHLSYLGPVSFVFTSWASFPQGSPSGVTAVWWLLDGRCSLSSWIPQDSPAHTEGLQSLMTVTSLFTDMDGSIPFSYSQTPLPRHTPAGYPPGQRICDMYPSWLQPPYQTQRLGKGQIWAQYFLPTWQ